MHHVHHVHGWIDRGALAHPSPPPPHAHHRKHIGSEPFWGARVAVAEALSDAPSNTSADILVGVRFSHGSVARSLWVSTQMPMPSFFITTHPG